MRWMVLVATLMGGCSYPELHAIDAGDDVADALDGTDATWDPVPADVPADLRTAHVDHALPPSGWSSANASVQALHDARLPGTSMVEVDWVQLIAVVGKEMVLVGDTPGVDTGIGWAKTFLRNPWFDEATAMPLTAPVGDFWSFAPSTDATRVWGFGGNRAPMIPAGATHCVMRARVKITGPALVQGLIHYRDSQSGTQQLLAGVSAWYGASGDWQTVEVDLSH